MNGKFICPPLDLSRAERKQHIIRQVENWLSSDAITALAKALGRDEGFRGTDVIRDSAQFFSRFDFRKGLERDMIEEDEEINGKKQQFYHAYLELGMINNTTSWISDPDYLLILGGANEANISRVMKAKSIFDDLKSKPAVAALTGFRMLSSAEIERVKPYRGQTEFEVISNIMASVFGLDTYDECFFKNENINLQSCVRAFNLTESFSGKSVELFAAPSSRPTRRADSRDTFDFFLRMKNLLPGKRLLLVSNSPYCNYQFLAFADMAIENDVLFDIIGDDSVFSYDSMKPTSYLQEVKAVTDCALHFLEGTW